MKKNISIEKWKTWMNMNWTNSIENGKVKQILIISLELNKFRETQENLKTWEKFNIFK
jgi:hypothetical protein